VAAYLAGGKIDVLAGEYSMHRQTVRAHLLRRGVPLRSDSPLLKDKQIAKIVEHYQAGVPSPELGQSYGVDSSTIRNVLRRAGVTLRPRGKPSHTFGS
jgi:hypothetical protein